MGMLEIPGTLRAGSINMDADATGGGDSIGNKFSQKFSFIGIVFLIIFMYFALSPLKKPWKKTFKVWY